MTLFPDAFISSSIALFLAFYLSSSVSSKILLSPFKAICFLTFMFSSVLFNFSSSFSKFSMRSLVRADLLPAPCFPDPPAVYEAPKFKFYIISSFVKSTLLLLSSTLSESEPSVFLVFFLPIFAFLISSGILKPPEKPLRLLLKNLGTFAAFISSV